MTSIRVEEVSNKTEELLLAGMITSTSFLSWVEPRFKAKYIHNDQIRTLSEMVLEHFKLYGEAPNESMNELFASVEDHMGKEDAIISRRLLGKISKAYGGHEVSFQILSDTISEYFEVRSVEILSDKIAGLSKMGKTEEAITEVHNWVHEPDGSKSDAVSPFDESFASAILHSEQELFRFNSDLDIVFPKQVRNKMYTLLGGTKSGKSQWLGWLATEGLANGLKVLVWEYELTQIEFLHRLLSAITGKGIKQSVDDTEVTTGISVFDCVKNRDNSCENVNRPNQVSTPDFNVYDDLDWIPCTHCRGTDMFKPVVWKQPFTKSLINTVAKLKKEMRIWERQFGNNIRIFNRDPGTQTVHDLKNELNRIKISDGFIPDMIVIDAADNIRPSKSYKDKRHELNNIWSELSILSKHGYLVWTASQTNRSGWNKEWITTEMIGEDASKLMICDGTILINQYSEPDGVNEYYWNTQRLRAAYFRGQQLPSYDLKVVNDFSRYIACLDCVKYR